MNARTGPVDRHSCQKLDRTDPLAGFRTRFELPPETIYLDGNSLGPLPAHATARLGAVMREEWGAGLVRSWNDAGWFVKPESVGAQIAPLIGANADEVVIGDSTSLAIYQAAIAGARMRPDRTVVISERDNFPTDLYILEGVQQAQGLTRRLIHDDGPTLGEVLGDDVAVVVLSHVNYRTGRMYDMSSVTRQVQEAGAVMVWDLCHSVGAVPVDLTSAGTDFAVGCTYKYLNGGPGAPAFLFCAARHHDVVRPPLTGWHGHARPFDFAPEYAPAPGITRFRVGTPQILSLSALEASLEIWADVDLSAVRAKSLQLTDLFIELIETRLAGEVEIVVPREHARRGSQVSLRRPVGGYALMQALIARGVIGDFRAPDLLRFGFTPLYTSFTDVWDAVDVLADILATGQWRQAQFQNQSAVT